MVMNTIARCLARTPLLLAPFALVPLAGTLLLARDRVYIDQWSPTRSELFIADGDGAHPRKLVPGSAIDYNASFSDDGQWVVFTSERHGSADIFRVRTTGMGLERLTDDPAYDDQAALSPDGRSLAFVSTRGDGSTDIYVLDLETRKTRNLTKAAGGDFRPAWSPDGQMIAFSSDRGTTFQMSKGRWEHLHATRVYVVGADGQRLRTVTADGQAAGSPKWSADGRRVVFYELAVANTFDVRQLQDQPTVDARIVSIELETGVRREHAGGRGLKVSPQSLGGDRVGYLEKAGPTATIAFSTGDRGSSGDIGNPAWTRDGSRLVYHSGPIATIPEPRAPGQPLAGRDPRIDLRFASGFPAVSPDGQRLVVSERTGRNNPDDRTALVVWHTDGASPQRIFRAEGSIMGPHWSPNGRQIVFGAGNFFLGRTRPAQLMVVDADGSGARTLTTGPGNAGFPSWSPDGTSIVYRFWTDTAGGLRVMNLSDGSTRTLTDGYDNFPMWSPKGDRITFNRLANGEFDIYTIRPDGTGLKQLTHAPGNDSHPAWSAGGDFILFSSSRLGFRDEAALCDIPQPYGELFIMDADGSNQRVLTDNRWEEGTPAWVPEPSKK
jgi:Tol biopolymer transport system component